MAQFAEALRYKPEVLGFDGGNGTFLSAAL